MVQSTDNRSNNRCNIESDRTGSTTHTDARHRNSRTRTLLYMGATTMDNSKKHNDVDR